MFQAGKYPALQKARFGEFLYCSPYRFVFCCDYTKRLATVWTGCKMMEDFFKTRRIVLSLAFVHFALYNFTIHVSLRFRRTVSWGWLVRLVCSICLARASRDMTVPIGISKAVEISR